MYGKEDVQNYVYNIQYMKVQLLTEKISIVNTNFFYNINIENIENEKKILKILERRNIKFILLIY